MNKVLLVADAQEEEDQTQQQPSHGGPHWLGHGLAGTSISIQAQLSHCVHEVSFT
jgi:hypothetical protein